MIDEKMCACQDCIKKYYYSIETLDHTSTFWHNNPNNPTNNIHGWCNSPNSILLNITKNEYYIITKVSPYIPFILAMNKLKETDIIEYYTKIATFKLIPSSTTNTTNTPKCPTCGSTNIKRISATERYVGTGMVGLASSNLGHTMQCLNCGYKW